MRGWGSALMHGFVWVYPTRIFECDDNVVWGVLLGKSVWGADEGTRVQEGEGLET